MDVYHTEDSLDNIAPWIYTLNGRMRSADTKSHAVKVLLATFIAPLAGATLLYLLIMSGKLIESVSSDQAVGYILFMLMMAVAQIMLFAVIMFVATAVLVMPIYFVLTYFGKANWKSVNAIGLIIGIVVGELFYSSNEYGTSSTIFICALCGVATSSVFYAIARPF